jgi:acetoacetyl-CoA reductase
LDKLAIVTGGTSGVGASISQALSDAGFDVIANYYLDDEKAELFASKTGIKVMRWNVLDYEECEKAVKEIRENYKKPVSALINNAGITRDVPFFKMSRKEWVDVVHNNLDSCFNMSRAAINCMRENKYGRIINISSINSQTRLNKQINYAAAKGGIIGFTKSLAYEYASKNITVNSITPGYVMTEIAAKLPKEIMDKISMLMPKARMGKPEDISSAVLFLVSEEAEYITGEDISIDGGQSIF